MTAIDSEKLRSALTLLVGGFPFEVRILGGMDRPGGKAMTFSGYFDSPDAVEPALKRIRGGWHGVYVTPNPVDSALLHRCYNRIELAQRNATTTDAQITSRRWLLADFDPVTIGDNGPIKGIAATDGEKSHALACALAVRDALCARGWPMPILADSGNGYHLVWRCDLPAQSELPKQFLDALAVEFASIAGDTVLIDTSIANPARIWKLYGTLACKGAGVGDRPHRLAQTVDVPDPLVPVDPQLIEAFVASVAPVVPAPVPAATTATRAPAVGVSSEFDAVALCESRGLSLGAPKVRTGGDVVRECSGACPCGKLTGADARGAYLVVAKSGAIGLGCRHASCDYSDSQRKPGDSWKSWRAANDPDYSPDAGGSPAATLARGASVADRLARASAGGDVDMSAFVAPDAVAHAEPAATVPAARAARDSRPLVDVSVDSADLRQTVLAALAGDRSLYLTQGDFARIGDGYRMEVLDAGALDAFVAKRCRFVMYRTDRETSALVASPRELPPRILKQLQSLLPEDLHMFRTVNQVTRAPFFTASGQLVASSGYNGEAQTLIVDCPPVRLDAFPDGGFALQFLRELVRDFPFAGGIYGPECTNWIGALIAPMVRPMIRGPMPMLLIEANRHGTGKTFLAKLIAVIHGLPGEVGPMQKDETAFAKQLFSILREAKPVHIFDDVQHTVVSQSLDMVLTSDTYTDRLLGESKSLHFVVRTLWIMTSNNARLSRDMTRRFIRCRLQTEMERPEERRDFKITDPLGNAIAQRGEILSALTQIVHEWIAAGAPLAPDLPRLGSFESFADVIGSILAFHGERQWLANLNDAKDATTVDDEWEPFLAAWHAEVTLFPRTLRAKELHAICEREGVMGSILSHGSELSQASRLASALRSRHQQTLYGFLITVSKDAHSSQRVYSISRVPAARVDTGGRVS